MNRSSEGSKILLTFKNIDDIDLLDPSFRSSCTSLMLSQNRIADLRGLLQFKNLKNLSLSFNYITDINQVKLLNPDQQHLLTFSKREDVGYDEKETAPPPTSLPLPPNSFLHLSLESLTLEGNFIQHHPNYRHTVISLFPNLKSLDSKPVKKSERAEIADGKTLQPEIISCFIALADHIPFALLNFATHFFRVIFFLSLDSWPAFLLLLSIDLFRQVSRLAIKLELFRRAYGTHSVFFRNDPPDQSDILKRYAQYSNVVLHKRELGQDHFPDQKPKNPFLKKGHSLYSEEDIAAQSEDDPEQEESAEIRPISANPSTAAAPTNNRVSPVFIRSFIEDNFDSYSMSKYLSEDYLLAKWIQNNFEKAQEKNSKGEQIGFKVPSFDVIKKNKTQEIGKYLMVSAARRRERSVFDISFIIRFCILFPFFRIQYTNSMLQWTRKRLSLSKTNKNLQSIRQISCT